MSSPSLLFDRTRYKHNISQACVHADYDPFLAHLAQERISERLDYITRCFDKVAIFNAPDRQLAYHRNIGYAIFCNNIAGNATNCVADEEWLPLQTASCDAILFIGGLHHVNDLVGTFIQARHALKADGLCLAITPGAQTFHELRNAWHYAEMHHHGGISPRISPFMDVRDAGALLGRAGFSLPVIDSEHIPLSYSNVADIYRDIRMMGEQNCLHERKRSMVTSAMLKTVETFYADHNRKDEERLTLTAELLAITAWKPHTSQPKPLARGSGAVSLKDVFQ